MTISFIEPLRVLKKIIYVKIFKFIICKKNYLFLIPQDRISSNFTVDSEYEKSIVEIIKLYATKKKFNHFFIDIGANIGLVSCQVHSFFRYIRMYEPNPICSNVLKSNILLSSFKSRYDISEYALSNDGSDCFLFIPKSNLGGAFIKSKDNSYTEEIIAKKEGKRKFSNLNLNKIKIETKIMNSEFKKLFKFLNKQSYKKGIIKIDTEGMEQAIILKLLEFLPKGFELAIIFENWKPTLDLKIKFTNLELTFKKIHNNKDFHNLSLFSKLIKILTPTKENIFIGNLNSDQANGDILLIAKNCN